MNQIYMELKQRVSNEGLHPGVHAEDTYPVIGCMGPFLPGNCLSNSWELLIRLSYFLWDTLFGFPEGQGLSPDSPMFSPQSLTLALDLEEETSKICEELWQTRNLIKFKKKMLGINLETVLLGHRGT